jgi:hypothetical protein
MLCFAEEIYLLALDEKTGKVMPEARYPVLGTVLIGAVLTELKFLKKISTDKERLYIHDTSPTKSLILNEVLGIFLESRKKEADIDRVLQVLMAHAKRIEELVLAELIEKGILKEVDKKILWIFPDRSYPLINDREIVAVEKRIREILLEGKEPGARDAALISLLRSSELFTKILTPAELERCEERINELSENCNIGQKIDELVYKIKDYTSYPPFI